jgi:hypothetical protein
MAFWGCNGCWFLLGLGIRKGSAVAAIQGRLMRWNMDESGDHLMTTSGEFRCFQSVGIPAHIAHLNPFTRRIPEYEYE